MDGAGREERAGEQGDAGAEIVMFFLGPSGEVLEQDPNAPPRRTLAEVRAAWRAALEIERRHDPYGRTRLDPRPVQGTGRPAKPGYRDEIRVTIRSAPDEAVIAAVDGALLDPPIRGLDVDSDTVRARRYELAWDATLRLRPWRVRKVTVRLYASPSLNVTALAMSPTMPRTVARRRFLRVGNRVMSELGERLDRLVDQPGRS